MTLNDNKQKEPKILVVSNNPFSKTNNNGKTLASFFKSFNPNNVAQLYFNSELPSEDHFGNYYQITDSSILKSIVLCNKKSGSEIKIDKIDKFIYEHKKPIYIISTLKSILIKSNIARLLRELIWQVGKWETDDLNLWIDNFSPDIVFFCAGDSKFAYHITNKIKNKYNIKLIVYMTDDYVLPRKTLNIFWWIRRNTILKEMKKILENSDLYMTISCKMKIVYKDFLGKDSIVSVNMTESLNKTLNKPCNNTCINLVYAGGLHLNRYKPLILLGKAIEKYNLNLQNENKIYLKIYSNNIPNSNIINKINIPGASEFCGILNSVELRNVLNKCDIPVHVESFDKKSIEATRLSISTKIPEYLSLGKPILAIGPKEVASMEYLEDAAFCINNQDEILNKLQLLLNDEELRIKLARLSLNKFNKYHDVEKNTLNLRQEIMSLIK